MLLVLVEDGVQVEGRVLPREAENEADRLGVAYVYQAGVNPDGMVTFFEKLLERIPSRYLLKATLYLFGEPFFNRHLTTMIEGFRSRSVPTSTSR